MSWFLVDDRFNSHPKATAASLAAIGLWTVAGSWSNEHLTDGFVPDHQIPSLSRGQVELAKELVKAGLWKRTRGGYQFHEFHADGDGTPRNQTRSEAIAKRSRMSSGGALGNHRRWHVDKGKTDPKCAFCQGEPDRPPNRVPDRGGESGSDSGANPPVPVQSPKGTRTGKGSQSSSRRNARGPEDDDSIDLAIVQLLTELTGTDVGIQHAAVVRRRILDGQQIHTSRLAYITRSIRNDPTRWLPTTPPGDAPRLHVVPDPPELPWCGYCDPHDRRIELADGTVARCQECHPKALNPYREIS